ncbi:hypothetical protein F5879DRAFT_962411 [Lentinula edodes]|nr:hypothetical protein F5879DRAFT_962411 [Lentinula edodes]
MAENGLNFIAQHFILVHSSTSIRIIAEPSPRCKRIKPTSELTVSSYRFYPALTMSVKVSKSITNEPVAADTMDLYRDFHLPLFEKNSSLVLPPPYAESHVHLHPDQLDDDCSSPHQCPNAQRCHGSRLRRVVLPIVVSLVSLGGLLALTCVLDAFFEVGEAGSLFKRATDGNGTFVNNKLYLIIVFVGLLLVVILGICLSAWCCRGMFITTVSAFLIL